MKVKEISRTANVAWSPSALQSIHLACGTVAQQLDATFRSADATYYSFGFTETSVKAGVVLWEESGGDNQVLCETGCAESKLVQKALDAYKYKQLQICSLQQYQVMIGVNCA